MTTYTSPQDGTTLDTFMASDAATTNYSSDGAFLVGESNLSTAKYRELVQFPGLSNGTIPSIADISSASLFVKIIGDQSSNDRSMRVFRSKRSVVISQATYNIYSTGNNWQTAGGFGTNDCEQTDIGNASISASTAVGTWIEISLTASAIEEIVNGTWTTPTFLLKMDTETNDLWVCASSNYATAADRPYIVVNYVAGGQVIMFS